MQKESQPKDKIHEVERFVIGQDYVVAQYKNAAYSFRFNKEDPKNIKKKKGPFSLLKKLKIPVELNFNEIQLENIIVTSHPDRVIFQSSFNLVVWDIKKNMEVSNFARREDDNFLFYMYAPIKDVKEAMESKNTKKKKKKPPAKPKEENKNKDRKEVYKIEDEEEEDKEEEYANSYKVSDTGYLVFDKYYVECNTMIPYPYMKFEGVDLEEKYWDSGPKMNSDESLALVNGSIFSSWSYQDIIFRDGIKENPLGKFHSSLRSIVF